MTKFFYKALKDKKDIVTDYIEAENLSDARLKIIAIGFLPTEIYEEKLDTAANTKSQKRTQNIRLSLNEKIAFTSELQNLLSASVSMLDALESVVKYPPSKKIELIAQALSDSIKNGATFTEALEEFSYSFGDIYVSICMAGENSGTLPDVLAYLLALLKKQSSLKGKYIQMCIYPAILVLIMAILYFLAGGVIFPKFVGTLQMDPTPLAAFFMDSVSFIVHYWLFILIAIAGSLYGLNCVCSFEMLKEKVSEFCLKIPMLGNCIHYFSLTHYMSVMHIAYDAGIPIVKALKMAEQTIANKVLRQQAARATLLIENGKSISEAYEISALIPGVLMPLIITGEKTGKLGQMFRDASLGIEKKLDMALEMLAKAFEPFMIVVIGIFTAIFAIAFIQMYSASLGALGDMF